MTKLTEHFTLEELTFSQEAIRKGINNEPSEAIKRNLKTLADNLERVRTILSNPLYISSGYRSFELNKSIGGSKTSAHMDGYAADFTCPQFGTPEEIAHKLQMANINCDQCIMEGTWVHISFDPKMRKQFLKAKFIGGKAYYSPFN